MTRRRVWTARLRRTACLSTDFRHSGFPGGQIALEPLAILGADVQAAFGAPPEDVFGGTGPFMIAKVVDFAGVEAVAETQTQVFQAGRTPENFRAVGAVAPGKSLKVTRRRRKGVGYISLYPS